MTEPATPEPGQPRADRIELPELGLVVLCGPSGSGKSTFARQHFAETEIVSSDQCRAMVGDDETDQSVTTQAFELLHTIVDKRLQLGRFTVVDATNVRAEDRKPIVELARRWDVLVNAIVFDVPLRLCLDRNAQRADRQTPEHAIRRQHQSLRRAKKGLRRERFQRVHLLGSSSSGYELDQGPGQVTVVRTKLWNDRRHDGGPFDIIGDVHGCHEELVALLDRLGYDTTAHPVRHPSGRRALFLGDLVDRGPGTDRVLDLAMDMVDHGSAMCIMGNHENKLGRALAGRKVKVSHGLAESLEQLAGRDETFRSRVKVFIDGLVSHYVLDEGRLVVAHAGLAERYHGRASGRVRSLALYGDTNGETDDFGLPVRYPWAEDYRGQASVVYGHTPVPEAVWLNNTICLDTGAVFGGELTALRWPERELVSVPAVREHYAPTRPLHPAADPETRPLNLLEVDEVLGKHRIETSLAGALTIDAERSSAAIEVMSRFAVDPRWLIYLPPTMAPANTSDLTDHLEHPDQAFAYYRDAGVERVVCQEKHMGSRAVVIMARSRAAAQARFGITNPAAGVVVTRTGRPFFADGAQTEGLLEGIRRTVDAAGWWDEFGTDWLAFDGELLPWSVKAGQLLKQQYGATGAAGRTSLAAAEAALDLAVQRALDVPELEQLAARVGERGVDVGRFVEAYRAYCWDTDGLDGVEFAPFQLLAAEGEVLARRSHRWHLEQIDQLVATDRQRPDEPALLRATRRVEVDLGDQASMAAATEWWVAQTDAGGEGMVVKPVEPIVRGDRGLVLPGIKCRGPEYLRLIYGPEYRRPANLDRLRRRSVGRKSSLARREFALGLEALDRFVANEHLYRVHQCVFAILALESEPVDPRL